MFFDPRGNGLEPALETMLGSVAKRTEMAEAAVAAAGRLTWEAAARQMLKVIRQCVL
jgi:hypothetical protein